nr:putative mitotic spindle organizing protein Mzt1 [Schizosaccharomyces pombe]CCD31316.1 mitotic spindle organizing protein Mzt1 (predicted) [Schizosaccharomyces pombe]|eukprot:NP_001343106.1 putative mitotic spindle organizing protein Mzt1 [Schizosaccharomyces pombe]
MSYSETPIPVNLTLPTCYEVYIIRLVYYKVSSFMSESTKETIEVLYEIGTLLGTELDKTTLSLCISLCENNVHPEAIAQIIREIRMAQEQTVDTEPS